MKRILVGRAGSGKTKYLTTSGGLDNNNTVVLCEDKEEFSTFLNAAVYEINESSPAASTIALIRALSANINAIGTLVIDEAPKILSVSSALEDLLLDAVDLEGCDVYLSAQSLKPLAPLFCERQRHIEMLREFDVNCHGRFSGAAMDENVGRIIETLKQQGLDENTWVIFTSDNGGLSTLYRENAPTSNGPLRAGKGWCYEGGIRVPLIITGPDIINPGRTEETPVVSMDFYNTILNLCSNTTVKNDGENLVPLLKGNGPVNRNELFWHYPHYHGSAWKPGSAIRKENWKLIVHYEDNRTELFNLKNDPGETTDISEKNPEKMTELKTLLDKKLAETNARFPEPNPDYAPRD